MAKFKLNNIADLPASTTSHGLGIKKTFIFGNESSDNLTQYAYAKLESGEIIEPHSHNSMNEYFFVFSGNGVLNINKKSHKIKKGDCFFIEKGTLHQVYSDSLENPLELIYFGISE